MKDKNFKWTEAKYKYLADTVIDLKKNRIRNVNKAAADKLGRMDQGVAKIKTKTNYKRVELRVKEKLLQKETTQIKDITESLKAK